MDTSEGASNIVMPIENEVEEKFHVFVKAYVSEFEKKLQKYTEAAVGWQGYESIIATVVVASIAAFVPLYGNWLSGYNSCLLFVGIVLPLVLKCYCLGKRYREKAKKITRIFNSVQKEELRRILVEAAGSIFYSFQSQFMVATDAGGDWKRGLLKLAIDAFDRSLSYIETKNNMLLNDAVSKDFLTKAFIQGKLKDVTKPGPILKREKSLTNWKLSELYEKVGVKIMGSNGQMKYYKSSLCGHNFGYRWPFNWEDENSLLVAKYEEDSRTYFSLNELEAKIVLVLEDINKKDPQFKLNRIEDNTDGIKETLESVTLSQSEAIDVVAKHEDIACIMQEINDTKEAISSEVPEEDEPIFNVMPPVKSFTGRTGELIELHEKLQKPQKPMLVSQCAVLSGLGGVGKSELARKYAWEYHNLYKHIIWINCEKKLDTLKSFKKLAEDLEILEKSPDDNKGMKMKKLEKDLQSIFPKIYKRLAKSKTLLIFDNADQFQDIKDFLPLNLYPAYRRPAIIITSRSIDWDIGEEGDVDVISLKEFTRDEARSYVKKSLQIKAEDNSCDTLVSDLIWTLCFFPLALHQAVSCIETKGSLRNAIQEYLNEFRDEETKRNLLKWRPKHDRYTETTYTTWLVTFENIRKKERNGTLAMFVVEIMSYIKANYITPGFFTDFVDEDMKCKDARYILFKYSITTVQYGSVYINRLVKLVVRLWLKDNQREEKILSMALTKVYKKLHYPQNTALLSYACNYITLIDDYFCKTYEKSIDLGAFIAALNNLVNNGNVLLITKIFDYLESKIHLWHKLCSKMFDKERVKCNHNDPSTEDASHDKHVKNIYLFHTEVNKALKTSKTEDLEEFLQSFDKRLINSWLYGCTALHTSVRSGNLDVVNMLINNGADVNFRDIHDDYPLTVAICEGQLEVAGYLLGKGADPNPHARVGSGRKPIHFAAFFGHLNIMPLLANTKEDFENRSKDDWTPLHFAAETDQQEIVEFLISKGVDVTAVTEDGRTACHIAVGNGSIRVVKYLIENQLVDVTLRNGKNETLLHTAAEHEHIDIFKYLLSVESRAKEHINAFDDWGVTPLFLAVASSNIEIVKLLIQHGASVDNVKNETSLLGKLKLSALHWADNFIKQVAGVGNGQNESTLLGKLKLSALHVAAVLDRLEIAKILVEEAKADINMGLDSSVSPLQVAKFFDSTKVRDFLLEKGADESAKDNAKNIRRIFLSFIKSRDKANINHYMDKVTRLVQRLLDCHVSNALKTESCVSIHRSLLMPNTFFNRLSSYISGSRENINETEGIEELSLHF